MQLKGQVDVGALKVLLGPRVELFENSTPEVVLPVADLSFPEELLHDLFHRLVPHCHVPGAVLAVVADVQVVLLEQGTLPS